LKLGCANVHDPFGFVGSSMTLSAIPQPLKDGGVVLMPVWILQMDFYPLTPDRTAIDYSSQPEDAATFMLVINAIDGSRCVMPRERAARKH
ncbi:MAG: hypothetical protein IKZ44_05560, partial [Clostridia bacterium]|nr:hypothetical protein [Clostridia bacterium]